MKTLLHLSLSLTFIGCITPGQILDKLDGGSDGGSDAGSDGGTCAAEYDTAPAPASTCAPFFSTPSEPPDRDTQPIAHVNDPSHPLVNGDEVEVMIDESGIPVLPLTMPLPGSSSFTCYRVVATATVAGLTIATPPVQPISDQGSLDMEVVHVRVPDAPGRDVTITMTFQTGETYTSWTRTLRLTAPSLCALGCEPLAHRFTIRRTEFASDLLACESASDCAMVSPWLECDEPAISLADCPIAMRADAAETYRSRIELLSSALCTGQAPCRAGPRCLLEHAECVSNTCVAVPD